MQHDALSAIALQRSLPFPARLQGDIALGAAWRFLLGGSPPLSARTLLGRFLHHLRLQFHQTPMHFVLNLDERGFRVRSSPFLDVAQNLLALLH